ncbi:glucose PTS transporter subunit IIA [Mycoplasmopsis agassizii]|uniref:glucose PTS transporter subunit IIA n=1 Tax=Mycoplasmopsis agassizii TaxID=33922 RepID=UPI0009D8F2EE|nr:glucose PTS transporter subunit IIA [Mycoplasmopsis agassizii]SMC17144.1 PTS system N-acetylglucosamine-specific IIB component, Glc family /PTS system N-acetylglucosamine-specific IIC component, Glc family [Mycoplasmopsis agassizii]
MVQALTNKKVNKSPKKNFSVKSWWNKTLAVLQRVGKSLMYPIAVLPIAALLLRIGALIEDPFSNGSIGINEAQKFIGILIKTPGDIVFSNLPLIFAIGIAFGLANDNRGEAALVGALLWLGMNALLKENMLPFQIYRNVLQAEMVTKLAENNNPATTANLSQLLFFGKKGVAVYQLDAGVFGGIISGAIVAKLYNRFRHVKLHQALSFFGGRRFIPMLGIVSIIPLALAISITWPWIQYALIKIGNALSSAQGAARGAASGAYAILNRLLQPFGLHHIINTFVWFQLPISGLNFATGELIEVNGDITAFNRGIVNSGLFTTGFFPLFLGGLLGAALAMVLTSDKDKRKRMFFFFGGTALVSFLTGIDEPLIFSFIFVSPLLYGINALLTGIFSAIVASTSMSIGIGFSAGLIDYIVSFPVSWGISTSVHNTANHVAANPLWILLISPIMGVVQFFVFWWIIKKTKVPIPGREKQLGLPEIEYSADVFDKDEPTKDKKKEKPSDQPYKDKYDALAANILDIVGVDNVIVAENCATRLRLTVKDNTKIDETKIKQLGVKGIVKLGNEGFQAIIGTDVEHVADYFRTRIETNNAGFVSKDKPQQVETLATTKADKLTNPVIIKAPISGEIKTLKSLEDGVFSEKMLGDGFVISTKDHKGKLKIAAPISGKLTALFDAKHAYGITNENGVKVLVHIGLDTVKLQGKGFVTKLVQDQEIKLGQLLVEIDLDLIRENNLPDDIIVVVLEESQHKDLEQTKVQNAKMGETILKVR